MPAVLIKYFATPFFSIFFSPTHNLIFSLESFAVEVEAGALFLPFNLRPMGADWLSELGLLGGESFIWSCVTTAKAPGCCGGGCWGGGDGCWDRLPALLLLEAGAELLLKWLFMLWLLLLFALRFLARELRSLFSVECDL